MWAKVDDHLDEHKKVFIAGERLGGPNATGRVLAIWLEGRLWTNRNNTLGFMPLNIVRRFQHDEEPLTVAAALALPVTDDERMRWNIGSANCLWVEVPGGYRFHDDEKYRPKKAAEELHEERAEAGRRGGLASATKRKQTSQQTSKQTVKQVASGLLKPEPQKRGETGWEIPHPGQAKLKQTTNPVSRIPDPGTPDPSTTEEREERAPSAQTFDDSTNLLQFRRDRSKGQTVDGRPRIDVIAALVRNFLSQAQPADVQTHGDLIERVKQMCADANLRYDSASVTRAIERAFRQLDRPAKGGRR